MRARNIFLWTMTGAAVLSCFAALAFALPALGQDCPLNPPVTLSPDAPKDVCIPSTFQGNAIKYFDDFSWRSFAALVWPSQKNSRGLPDTSQPIGASGYRVFEMYKAPWEVFHDDATPPLPWNLYDNRNACKINPGYGGLVLASYSKYSELGQAGIAELVGPLPAQNGTYLRFLTGMNEVLFGQIANQQLYLRKNLPAPPKTLMFKNGALDVKSAWIDMEGIPNPERYYTTTAWVFDRKADKCLPRKMGLVGLHIVQKTPSRPQWIWSTFEHVDNLPGKQGARSPFNDGSGKPMPSSNPNSLDPLTIPPKLFNLQRLKPIHASTQATNAQYQKALSQKNSVWQYYQLVMTQWPLDRNKPDVTGDPDHTFPGTAEAGDDTTAYSNVTMETFDQESVDMGCMGCHTITKDATDFLWVLYDHAIPAKIPNARRNDAAFQALAALLKREGQAPEPKPEPKRKPGRR